MSANQERKSIWHSVFSRIKGGWRTWGPGSGGGDGAFASDDPFFNVTPQTALKLSAVFACVHLRAETIGSMPLHLRDANKNILTDHPLYRVLYQSPNADQTPAEYWSMCSAHEDMFGNALSIIEKRRNGEVVSLEPVYPVGAERTERKSGRKGYKLPGESVPYDANNIFHLRGFSMDPDWGCSRIDIGRQILAAQLNANDSAIRAFRQSIKVGGFFKVEQNLDKTQLKEFSDRLNAFARSENEGKMMTLLKGMDPVSGKQYRITPAEAELLPSRYFGIEEICRLFNTPPQLIGHTDKASSWASSMEMLNLFFLVYGLQPTLVRREQRIYKSLLTPEDRAKGIRAKHQVDGLLRSDTKTRWQFYASGLQNGYLSQNEVRDMEERVSIGPEGDVFRVQMNMAGAGNEGGNNENDDEKDNKK